MTTPSALERALHQAGAQPATLAASAPPPEPGRLDENLWVIEAVLDAPAPGRLARVLARLGVPDATIPLVTATPGLRRSWLAAVAGAVLFSLAAAGSSTADGTDRISAFLTIAPLVPLLGVALSYGRAVDPTREIAVAAPIDGFRLFLVRAVTVVAASTVLLVAASAFLPAGGITRVAWLLPSLAVTAAALALAPHVGPRTATGAVATAWVVAVVVIRQSADAATAFGPATQLVSVLVAVVGSVVLWRGRRRLDSLSGEWA